MKLLLLFTLLLNLGVHFTQAQDAAPSPDSPPKVAAPAEEPASETPAEAAPAANPDASETEAVIPTAFDISRYQSTWDKNPFLLKTAPVVQTQVQWSQDWALAGMFNHKGKIRVSIKNKQTSEFKQVSSDAKPDAEFRLVKANFHRNRNEASAVIAKGAEEAELKYDEAAGGQPVTINNTMKSSTPPGQQPQGAVPGMPQAQRPGQVAGQVGGQPQITRPISPNTNGRVFNAPGLPGGVASQPGQIGGQPGAVMPQGIPGAQPGAAPPAISRRRQLIPAPVVPAQP
ncbi:MAG: hypothetical protein NTV80_03325 [Verrucomicrobia bacterium]|nr:hypothetical protein [Verrucomicrobiota bacterium]